MRISGRRARKRQPRLARAADARVQTARYVHGIMHRSVQNSQLPSSKTCYLTSHLVLFQQILSPLLLQCAIYTYGLKILSKIKEIYNTY